MNSYGNQHSSAAVKVKVQRSTSSPGKKGLVQFKGEHVLGEPLPGRYPWSQTFVCSCGAKLLSPEIARVHVENFNKNSSLSAVSSPTSSPLAGSVGAAQNGASPSPVSSPVTSSAILGDALTLSAPPVLASDAVEVATEPPSSPAGGTSKSKKKTKEAKSPKARSREE